MFFTLILPDLTKIDILAVYAPSDDCSEFWDSAHTIINTGKAEHRLMLGDFNCTMNHAIDSSGYKTDPHTKSRKVLSGILETEELIYSYRHFNPD